MRSKRVGKSEDMGVVPNASLWEKTKAKRNESNNKCRINCHPERSRRAANLGFDYVQPDRADEKSIPDIGKLMNK